MKKILKHNAFILIGICCGFIGGFLYWKYVGCSSGSCPITSSPIISAIYGGVMGGLFAAIFSNNKTSKKCDKI